MKENNDDFFNGGYDSFPPGILDDVKEKSNKLFESTNYFVCKTTYEITQYDAHGLEISTQVTTESSLISNDDTIKENKRKFINREEYLKFREEYLQSAKWQAKRQMVLLRDHYVCKACGTAKNLNVHHITYENFGNERISDLVTLCRDCHEKLHNCDERNKKASGAAKPVLPPYVDRAKLANCGVTVLGMIADDPTGYYLLHTARNLTPFCFVLERQQEILHAMIKLHSKKEEITENALVDHLKKEGKLAETGGERYVRQLFRLDMDFVSSNFDEDFKLLESLKGDEEI